MSFQLWKGLSWWALLWVCSSAFAQDGREDSSSRISHPMSQRGILSSIDALTIDHELIDFDAFRIGSFSVHKIQKIFPNSGIAEITTASHPRPGHYDFQTGSGLGLGVNLSGQELAILNVGQKMGSMHSMTIKLTGKAREFGFGIGDWNGPLSVTVRAGGSLIDTLLVQTNSEDDQHTLGSSHYIRATVAFDEVILATLPQDKDANWVLTFIGSQRRFAVPTLSQWSLLILFIFLLSAGLVFMRYRGSGFNQDAALGPG